jgi:uncharacterized protein YegP (UPF0339 family)
MEGSVPQFEVFEGETSDDPQHLPGQHYWRLRAVNGQIIAVGGEGYATRAGAYRAVGTVQTALTTILGNAAAERAETAAKAAEAPA